MRVFWHIDDGAVRRAVSPADHAVVTADDEVPPLPVAVSEHGLHEFLRSGMALAIVRALLEKQEQV